jgi:hypothetical protein
MRRKGDESEPEDEMRPEYDLSKIKIVGRGIYRERSRSGTNLVLLDQDVRKAFPDDESVNEALRVIAKAAKRLQLRDRLNEIPGLSFPEAENFPNIKLSALANENAVDAFLQIIAWSIERVKAAQQQQSIPVPPQSA